jgi:D-xylose reductase
LLRWATQRGFIVIPKSIKPERMAENLNSTDFDLESGDLEEISSLDRGFRFGNPKAFDPRLSIFA